MKRSLLITALNLSLLAGCSHVDRGGISEMIDPTLLTVEADKKLTSEHGLRFDYGILKNKLDILILRGAKYCFPASVRKAELQEIRIIRELDGELFYDAANDIVVQRIALARLERQLNYVVSREECVWRKHDGNMDGIRRLQDLLNSDNQFAFDDSEVNPKFAQKLKMAADYLQDFAHYRLRLYGHTDLKGDDVYNLKLSMQRAEKVKALLVESGLDGARIEVYAQSEHSPLFKGEEPHVRLVNRRVYIEIDIQSDYQQSWR